MLLSLVMNTLEDLRDRERKNLGVVDYYIHSSSEVKYFWSCLLSRGGGVYGGKDALYREGEERTLPSCFRSWPELGYRYALCNICTLKFLSGKKYVVCYQNMNLTS